MCIFGVVFFAVANAMETDFYTKLNDILSVFPILGLKDTGKVRLMDRTDSKYVANKRLLLSFLSLVKNDYSILEAGDKVVSAYLTTYWDTEDHRFYLSHHNGFRPRMKVRVRTYLDTNVSFLEIKNKDNHNKTHKTRMQMASPLDWENSEDEEFLEKKGDINLDEIHPCLTNRFSRVTLVNKAFTERLTIDFDVNFHNLETGLDAGTGDLVIMEVKRSAHETSPAIDAMLKLRIKPQGFSKYCIGTYLTNPDVKHNRFKKKLVRLHHLEDISEDSTLQQQY